MKSIREDTALPSSQSLACARPELVTMGLIGLAVLALILAGCAQVTYQEPPPTPQPLVVDYSPAVRTWQPALYACAATLPDVALFTHETPASRLDTQAADLALRLGAPAPGAADYAAQVGEEQIVAIVHADNPLQNLDGAALRQLYAGQAVQWGELAPGFDQVVQVWTYPQGDETRQLFEAALFGAAAPNVQGWLAPDPQAMLEAVAGDPGALGYLPRSWLAQGSVKELTLEAALSASLRHPVLALASAEPEGAARALLSCLQAAQR